jgi:hypothetical protein
VALGTTFSETLATFAAWEDCQLMFMAKMLE